MTDSPDDLETRLAQLRPRPLDPVLESRVAAALQLDGDRPAELCVPGNRFFWSAVATGAIAACVIAGVFLSEPAPARPSAFAQSTGHSLASPGPEPAALARADWRWSDEFNPDVHRSHR